MSNLNLPSPDELLRLLDTKSLVGMVKLGTIIAPVADGTSATVQFDGETTTSPNRRLCIGYTATVGDRVILLRVGNSWVILGAVAQNNGLYGDNSNGQWWLLPNELLICHATVTLVFITSDVVGATWTYPRAFTSTPAITLTLTGSIGGTSPALTQQSVLRTVNVTAADVLIQAWKQAGAPNYTSGSTWAVRAIAMGT